MKSCIYRSLNASKFVLEKNLMQSLRLFCVHRGKFKKTSALCMTTIFQSLATNQEYSLISTLVLVSTRAPRDAGSVPSRPVPGQDGTAKMKIRRDGTVRDRGAAGSGTGRDASRKSSVPRTVFCRFFEAKNSFFPNDCSRKALPSAKSV